MGPSGHKVVTITGGSAGIGRAIALRLARDGATIVLCARRADKLNETARDIEQAGGRALAIAADVTDAAAMQELVHQAVDRFGQLDVMICNAGFGIYGAVDTVDPAQMQRQLDVNFMGTYHAIRAALPVFRRQGRGHIFAISSIVGRRGIPFMGPYSATKFAQVGLIESVRAELRGSGVHVTCVYPISTETEFHGVMMRESGFATRASGPRQRPEIVADAIARAIDRPVPEIYPYRLSKLLAVLAVIAPGFCDSLVKRWGRQPLPPGTTVA